MWDMQFSRSKFSDRGMALRLNSSLTGELIYIQNDYIQNARHNESKISALGVLSEIIQSSSIQTCYPTNNVELLTHAGHHAVSYMGT